MSLPVTTVSEIASQVRGVTYSKGDAQDSPRPGHVALLRANNITDAGLALDDVIYVPESKVSDKQRLLPGDIVVATSSGSLDVVGKAAPVTEPIDATFGAFCKVVRPQLGKVHPPYLAQYFKSPAYRHRVSQLAAGANINNLRNEHLDDLELYLPYRNGIPDLEEQKRIAAILDKADAIRRKRQQAVRLTDYFLRSVFLDRFGDDKAETASVRELLNKGYLLLHKDGNHGSQYPRAHEFGDEGIAFLSANCIDEKGSIIRETAKYLEESKARSLKIGWIQKDDVLLAHNATVGPVTIYDGRFGRCLIGTSLTAYRPSPHAFTSEFLAAALRADRFQSQLIRSMSQTTRNQVPITAQRDFVLPNPPIEKQQQFSTVCKKAAEIQDRQLASSEQTDAAFASLQQRAFRGEL